MDSEVTDRLRRIETRLTRTMTHLGIPTGAQMPVFENDALHVPTPAVALKSCLDVIPPERRGGTIRVVCKGELLCVLAPRV